MDNNSTYIHWKSWNSELFSKTSKLDEAYFDNTVKLLDLNESSSILEIGFGNGSFLGYAKRNGFSCDGVETNIKLVDLAISKNFKVYKDIEERFNYII